MLTDLDILWAKLDILTSKLNYHLKLPQERQFQ